MILSLIYALIWAFNVHRCDYDWLIIFILFFLECSIVSYITKKPLISMELGKK